jgi:hypothetical protein
MSFLFTLHKWHKCSEDPDSNMEAIWLRIGWSPVKAYNAMGIGILGSQISSETFSAKKPVYVLVP